MEPQTIQFVGRAAELMTGCVSMEKYTNPENPIVSVHIGNVLVYNVLIDMGVAINFMAKQTMDQHSLSHLRLTPNVLELADRSKIKPKGVLDDVIISLDSWEYCIDFIMLQPKNPVGGHPLILGQPWLATTDAYIGCHSSDMYISHGDSRNKVTLYPLPDPFKTFEILYGWIKAVMKRLSPFPLSIIILGLHKKIRFKIS